MNCEQDVSDEMRRACNRPVRDGNPARMNEILLYLYRCFDQGGWAREHLHVVFLDSRRRFITNREIGSGRIDGLSMRLRPLFQLALGSGASNLIVAHNHPSGDCRPSASDLVATKRLEAVASALDINLLDHLILAPDRAYSMRAGGLL